MAYVATVDGYDYTFDFADQRIDIDSGLDTVNVINLYTAIKEAQASEEGAASPIIAKGTGLDSLSATTQTYLTVKLYNNWEVNSLKSSGKVEIESGNLIRNDGEDPFRDNSSITYISYAAQAGVLVTGASGGLTTEEHDQLMAILTATQWRTAVGVESDNTIDGELLAAKIKAIAAGVKNKMVQSGNDLIFYEEDGITEAFSVRLSSSGRTPI